MLDRWKTGEGGVFVGMRQVQHGGRTVPPPAQMDTLCISDIQAA